MWGVDLSHFQFDGNLTWAAIFMNGDGTIYGRYGTRAERDAMARMSMPGLLASMRGALELHRQYPANRAQLQDKLGDPRPWNSGETLPAHQGRFREGDTSRIGCVHCHFIDEGIVKSTWLAGSPVPDRLLWSYPMPDLLGFTLNPQQRATVTAVTAASEAAGAGLQVGDVIHTMQGQPILSIADVQWVLQHAPEDGSVGLEVERDGAPVDLQLQLHSGWRRRGQLTWRGGIFGLRPGINATELGPAERQAAGIAANHLALQVRAVQKQWGVVAGHGFQTDGLRKGDVIIAIDGSSQRLNDSEFLAWFWQNTRPGQAVELTVLRQSERLTMTVTTP